MKISKRITALVAVDIMSALMALPAAFLLDLRMLGIHTDFPSFSIGAIFLFALVVLLMSVIFEIYQRHRVLGIRQITARIAGSALISYAVISAVSYSVPLVAYDPWTLALSLLIFCALQIICHCGYSLFVRFHGLARRVLILGAGPVAGHIGGIIPESDENYVLSGYVNCSNEPVHVPRETLLETGDGLFETAKREKAGKIVVSLSERRGVFPIRDVMACKLSGIEVVDAPSFYEQVTGKLLLENITPSWFIFSDGFKITAVRRVMKRMTDLLLAGTGILLTAPFYPLIALAIMLDSGGPVFFRQLRVGEKEKNFTLFKFRTMRVDAEKATGAVWAQIKDPRVTRIGAFFRKSRIDEIPQLFNVFKGEMSLVGPRPERPEFVQKLKGIIPYYSERHFVKPGVTGWAQVRYPYGASVEDALEKLRYDLYYIKNLSLSLDLMIILETVKVVLFRRGGR